LIRFASRHETGRNRPEQTSQLPLPRLPPPSAELQDSLDIGGVDAEVSDLVSIDNAALEAIYDDDAPRIRILSPPPQLPENGPLSSAQLVAIMEAALPSHCSSMHCRGSCPTSTSRVSPQVMMTFELDFAHRNPLSCEFLQN
jgi:hypothetical protein